MCMRNEKTVVVLSTLRSLLVVSTQEDLTIFLLESFNHIIQNMRFFK